MEVTADIFKRLYLPHPKLYRIAFALVGNQEEAEDIVQEVYSRLWERRDELAVVRPDFPRIFGAPGRALRRKGICGKTASAVRAL